MKVDVALSVLIGLLGLIGLFFLWLGLFSNNKKEETR